MSLKSVRRLQTCRWPQGKTPGKSIFALAALLAPLAFFSSAKAEVIVSRYYVSLAGMNLGGAIVHTALSEKRYKVAVSADVGAVFINERVQGEATGSRAGAQLTPEHFTMVMSGSEERAVEIHFAGSTPKSTKITPPLPPELASRRPPQKGRSARGSRSVFGSAQRFVEAFALRQSLQRRAADLPGAGALRRKLASDA